ncbi:MULTISPECIES: plasmid segregation protein ParM domain-containing protein [Enterobacteriaceae]|nr:MULTISPECIES: plasmid segregation protein ParM domain-containing protein [Enterobacteriaceae]MDO3422829.1 plasmid segregation protein ParM [Citrobacter freundii]WNT24928.1 plasmid segregation protein ParM [Enterobacter cloacae]
MKIFCDDGSTNVKLAWFEGGRLRIRKIKHAKA